MILCPKCMSKQIACQRVDSDWHNNPAEQVNDDDCYESESLSRLASGRVQCGVVVNICMDCYYQFTDGWNTGPVPGNTLVAVKLNNEAVSVAKFVGNPGHWVSMYHLGATVVAWRPL